MCPDLSSISSFIPSNQLISHLMLYPQITISWAVSQRNTSKRLGFPNDDCMQMSSSNLSDTDQAVSKDSQVFDLI